MGVKRVARVEGHLAEHMALLQREIAISDDLGLEHERLEHAAEVARVQPRRLLKVS